MQISHAVALPRLREALSSFHLVPLAAMLFAVPVSANGAATSQSPINLKCDSMITPIDLDTPQPQLSWELQDHRFAARQTAYQLQVATKSESLLSGKADVWDSGRVSSDKSVGVAYAGPALKPEQRYYWRVKVWDKDGKPYPTERCYLVGNGSDAIGRMARSVDQFRASRREGDSRIGRAMDHQRRRHWFEGLRYAARFPL